MSDSYTISDKRQGGFALVVVLLMTMLTLMVIVTAVSISTSRSYAGGHASKQSDQALLAAQSGLDGFIPRVKAGAFAGTLYTIECWVEGYSQTELSTGGICNSTATRNLTTQNLTTQTGGPRATVDIVGPLDEIDSVFTVRSVGLVGPDTNPARAVLTQKFKLVKTPLLNMAPPAALTSCPSIKGGGSATISGGPQGQTAVVPVYVLGSKTTRVRVTGPTVTSTWPSTLSLTLSDPTLMLGRGNYVSVNNVVYRVLQRRSDSQITVTLADPNNPPPTPTSLSGDLNIVPFAVRNTVRATGMTATLQRTSKGRVTLPTYRLPFSDPSGVYEGDVLYVPIGNKTYAVTVTGKGMTDNDPEQGYVDVALSVTNEATNLYNVLKGSTTVATANYFVPPTEAQLLTLRPGTALSRYIAGGTSAGRINGQSGTANNSIVDWGGATTVGPAAMATNNTLDCDSEEGLFGQVFNGMTPSSYYDTVAPSDRVGANGVLPTLAGRLYWYGPKDYPSSASYSFSSSTLCGSGVLVINGNLDMQGTCAQGFTGVIYVMGDLKNAGNGSVNGAVIVQGSSPSSESSFTGSLDINFDQTAIVRSAKDLSKPVLSMQSGTWSQQ